MTASRDRRRVLLADADAFYVSVARLVDPAGAGQARLLIVGGSSERRGVVMSASYEARAFGVHSAMPMARALRLCPQALVVPVPWEMCAQKGRDIRRVLERFAPVVQQASIDEFYLDLTGTEWLYHGEPLADTARRIRADVAAETRLSLSIGGGTSRLVAKIAAGVAKPAGVCIVPGGGEVEFLRCLELAAFPGIGPKTAARFRAAGFTTAADVLPLEPRSLAQRLGGTRHTREAEWLFRLVRGVDDSRVRSRGIAKSISRDETFARDLESDEDLTRELGRLVDRATRDLRTSGLLARTITLKLRDFDFRTRLTRRTLARPVLSDRVVYEVARDLLGRLRGARRVPARLVGVALSGLVRQGSDLQLSLLADETTGELETGRDRTIARMLDGVRDRFGSAALRRGRSASDVSARPGPERDS
jgi:DNA polymerase-4